MTLSDQHPPPESVCEALGQSKLTQAELVPSAARAEGPRQGHEGLRVMAMSYRLAEGRVPQVYAFVKIQLSFPSQGTPPPKTQLTPG